MADAILQAKLEQAAHVVWESINGRCAVSLIACYGEDSSGDGCSFVTTLSLEQFAGSIEFVLLKWRSEEPIPRDAAVWVPDTFQLKQLADVVRDALPFAAVSAILFASGSNVLYVSFAQRAEMQHFIEQRLLPHLKARQAVTPQPEGQT